MGYLKLQYLGNNTLALRIFEEYSSFVSSAGHLHQINVMVIKFVLSYDSIKR